jgi:hypothetical protein
MWCVKLTDDMVWHRIRHSLYVGQFIIYTREAGLGRLSVAMEGPSRCDVNIQDLGNGTCEVTYVCTEPGMKLCSDSVRHIVCSWPSSFSCFTGLYLITCCCRMLLFLMLSEEAFCLLSNDPSAMRTQFVRCYKKSFKVMVLHGDCYWPAPLNKLAGHK